MQLLSSLDLPAVTVDQAAPAPGSLRLYGRSLAGRCLPEWVGGCGLNTVAQPLLAQNRVGFWNPAGDSTAAAGIFGIAAPTVAGTATFRTSAITNLLTRMKRIGYVGASPAGSNVQWRTYAVQHTLGNGAGLGGFTFIVRFGISDSAFVSGARMFVGLTSGTTALNNVEPSTILDCIGLAQLSTSPNLHIVYGGSAAQEPINLGPNFPAGTLSADAYEIALFAPPNIDNQVGYRVTRLGTDYVAEGTLTAATPGLQLPSSSTLLSVKIFRTNNATALAVGLDICSVYIETDY